MSSYTAGVLPLRLLLPCCEEVQANLEKRKTSCRRERPHEEFGEDDNGTWE